MITFFAIKSRRAKEEKACKRSKTAHLGPF
jgi:hypothetical protein